MLINATAARRRRTLSPRRLLARPGSAHNIRRLDFRRGAGVAERAGLENQ